MKTRVPEKRPAGESADKLMEPVVGDANMHRPFPISVGALLILLRAVVGLVVYLRILSHWDQYLVDVGIDTSTVDGADTGQVLHVAHIAMAVLFPVFYLLLAFFTFRGHNWARVAMMLITVLSINTDFITWVSSDLKLNHFTDLMSIALDIFILLALSSRSSAAYAQRRKSPLPEHAAS